MDARCKTCGMQRGEHDRACVNEQLHGQKLKIIKKLADLKKKHRSGLFLDRVVKSTIDAMIQIVQEA